MINQYIEIDPKRCNGKPIIAGTRIPITVILDQLGETGSIEKLLTKYPELTKAQIKGVLEFCHSLIEHSELELEHF
jgi:uncharacterized protein (DUF433 family)